MRITNANEVAIIALLVVWVVCIIICLLKGKYVMALLGIAATIAWNVLSRGIGGIYVLSLMQMLLLMPFFGAMRLAHPQSYSCSPLCNHEKNAPTAAK